MQLASPPGTEVGAARADRTVAPRAGASEVGGALGGAGLEEPGLAGRRAAYAVDAPQQRIVAPQHSY